MHKQLAVVFGATRGQGNSVVDALLETKRYRVRGVTRDINTPDARRLHDRGVDVIAVDLDDASTVSAALVDAQVVFAVTTMYDGNSARETQQGCNIMKATADLSTLQHLVWSTLPAASTLSDGAIPVPHMDGKAAVDRYIIESHPRLAERTTFYWGGFYAENATYPSYQPNKLASAGHRAWIQPVTPETPLPYIGDHRVNTGLIVLRVLERPKLTLPGHYVLGAVDWYAHGAYLRTWLNLLGDAKGQKLDAEYVQTDTDVVGRLWPGMGSELAQMLKLSEAYGREAWSKKDTKIVTVEDLGLEVGTNEGDLVTTESALRKLALEVHDKQC